jgi:DNA-binding transcriptional ArsR family regulator
VFPRGSEAFGPLARLQRLEQLVDGLTAAPAAQAAAAEPPDASLHGWVTARRRPGNHVLGLAVGSDGGIGTAFRVFDGEPPFDLRRAAALCQALGSETRLAMLRDLFRGERTTAELLAAVGLDRGQLYHHLRDLFVQGLVEQPERGRYALTGRGHCAFLVAGELLELGGRAPGLPLTDLDDGAEQGDAPRPDGSPETPST